MFTIGVDVGGTYTDLVATDETGRTVFAKSPSTPADQSIGVMAGLEELARRLNVSRADMLAATERTTAATHRIFEILDRNPSVAEPPGATVPTLQTPVGLA